MGWQEADDSRPDGTSDRDAGQPCLPAQFAHGGAWDMAAPSAALAVALEAAAGQEDRYPQADADALTGMVRQWAAVESWAAAGKLAGLRAMMCEDREGTPRHRRPGQPEGWDDSLNYEIAAALAMGPVSAENLAVLAWTLGVRLPGIGRLLAGGTLTVTKARLIATVFEPLSEDEAARAEALIVGELAGKTYFQVERLAVRAATAVAPDIAERRRSAAERERARVTLFREDAGTVGLSGRDLPAAQALSGHANVTARAVLYEASGAFPSHTTSGLQALAYLDLLNGVSTEDRIAFARTVGEPPEPPEPPESPEPPEPPESPESPEPPDTTEPPEPPEPPEPTEPTEPPDAPEPPQGPGPERGRPGGASARQPVPPSAPAVLPEVIVPLATLLGQARRPGDNRLLGALDPALARELAAAAARSPHSRWDITVVDGRGYATGHGIARAARTTRGGTRQPGPEPPGPAGGALPARVTITVTETHLNQLAAPASQPRSGAPPGGWRFTEDNDAGAWRLTLPGGRELTVRFDVVPTHDCDHRYRAAGYQPGERLRRLVQVRDHTCTFPTCSRPARESDFEHALPYDKGGATDACNAGARSRRCHQVKQSPGWTVTQPKPGWHQWQTPTGRIYTREPWRYTA